MHCLVFSSLVCKHTKHLILNKGENGSAAVLPQMFSRHAQRETKH